MIMIKMMEIEIIKTKIIKKEIQIKLLAYKEKVVKNLQLLIQVKIKTIFLKIYKINNLNYSTSNYNIEILIILHQTQIYFKMLHL
jgi:hypothetical protein